MSLGLDRYKYTKTDQTGFTLIELLVVISIIGVLASSVLVSLSNAREKAFDTKRVAFIKSTATALELYRIDHSEYPSTGSLNTVYAPTDCTSINADVKTNDWIPGLVNGGYISSLPVDPSPRDKICFLYSSNGEYFILSLWDGVPNTEQRYNTETNPLYSLAGFREHQFNQNCLFNHPNLNGSWAYGNYNFYTDSFTITNLPDNTRVNCTVP